MLALLRKGNSLTSRDLSRLSDCHSSLMSHDPGRSSIAPWPLLLPAAAAVESERGGTSGWFRARRAALDLCRAALRHAGTAAQRARSAVIQRDREEERQRGAEAERQRDGM